MSYSPSITARESGQPPLVAQVVINPATLEKIEEVPQVTSAQARETVHRARKAFAEWRATPFAERKRHVFALKDYILDHIDEFSALICRETGRVEMESLGLEIFYTLDVMQYWGKRAEKFLRDETVSLHLLKAKKGKIIYQPLGVVAIIAPYNFPIVLTLGEAIPALMAGNSVVIKPSPLSAATGRYIEKMAHEAGLPEGVLQVASGPAGVGETLISECDYVAFTGSVETGKRVMEHAAKTLKPVSLELGGKDPMLVLKDANLERAANAAVWGSFMNSGQVCEGIERVYVDLVIYDEFLGRVVEKTRRLGLGPFTDPRSEVGAMTDPRQLQVLDEQLRDALAKGARVLVGGKRKESLKGYFFEPTVLVDVNHSMKIMTEETFGPILPIMKFRDEEEAVRLANDSRYGLSSSVWSQDKRRAEIIARRIQAGTVCINECLLSYLAPELPFGGVKESGFGRRHGGAAGIRKFTNVRTLFIDRFGMSRELVWYPYHPKGPSVMKKLLRFLYASTLRRKVQAFTGRGK